MVANILHDAPELGRPADGHLLDSVRVQLDEVGLSWARRGARLGRLAVLVKRARLMIVQLWRKLASLGDRCGLGGEN